MKKFSIVLLIALFLTLSTLCFAFQAVTVSSAPGINGTFTSSVTIPQGTGTLSVSIYGTSWDATASIQRRFKNPAGGYSSWHTVEAVSTNTEKIISNPSLSVVQYRIGVLSGDYTSGSVTLTISE